MVYHSVTTQFVKKKKKTIFVYTFVYYSVTTKFGKKKKKSSSIPPTSSILEGKLSNMPLFIWALKSKIYVSFIYLDSQPPEVSNVYLCCTLLRLIILVLERKK